jgi:transcriptional regulator with XRE-family HTH domain
MKNDNAVVALQQEVNSITAEIEAMKAQLGTSLAQGNGFRDVGDIKRTMASDEFLSANMDEWKEIGGEYTTWRTEQGLSKTEVARSLGISINTLTKFEQGKPVLRARAIESAYDMLRYIYKINKDIEGLHKLYGRELYDEEIHDSEQWAAGVELDIDDLCKVTEPEKRQQVRKDLATLATYIINALSMPVIEKQDLN